MRTTAEIVEMKALVEATEHLRAEHAWTGIIHDPPADLERGEVFVFVCDRALQSTHAFVWVVAVDEGANPS